MLLCASAGSVPTRTWRGGSSHQTVKLPPLSNGLEDCTECTGGVGDLVESAKNNTQITARPMPAPPNHSQAFEIGKRRIPTSFPLMITGQRCSVISFPRVHQAGREFV